MPLSLVSPEESFLMQISQPELQIKAKTKHAIECVVYYKEDEIFSKSAHN